MELTWHSFQIINKTLEAQDGIKYVNLRFYDGAKRKDIQLFEKFTGNKTPEQILSFYEKAHGFYIHIEYQKIEYDAYVYGRCIVMNPDSFVNGPRFKSSRAAKKGERHKGYLWDDGDDLTLIKKLEDNFFILDFVNILSNTYVIFKLIENEPKLFLYKYPHYFFSLKLTFVEYLINCLKFRAVHCWQDYFIDKEECDQEALHYLSQERPDRFVYDVKQIYPEVDISDLSFVTTERNTYSFSERAKKKSYNNRFRNNLELLKQKTKNNRGQFELETNNQPLTILTVRKIEKIIGRKLPDSMLAFYSQMNGFKLNWSYKNLDIYGEKPLYFPRGSFNLLGLEQVFGGFDPLTRNWNDQMFEGIVTMKEVMDDKELTFAKQCRLINYEEFNNTVIRFVDAIEEPELYVIDQGQFIRLQLTFEEFIERLLENMGMEYWQRFFTSAGDFSDGSLATVAPVVKHINQVFPNVDTSGYRNVKSNVE